MRSGEISSDPSSSRRLRRALISCRRNAPTPMRNAAHTTSGGTSTLKSLITRAPPFGLRLPASFQLGTTRSPFLLGLAAGLSGQQPRAAVFAPKTKGDQLAFWPIVESSPPAPRPGDISAGPGRAGPGRGGNAPGWPAYQPPGSPGPAARATTSLPLPCWAAHERLGRDPGDLTPIRPRCRETPVPAGPGRSWPGRRPGRGPCAVPPSCRPAARGRPLHGLRRMSIIYREDHQTGKVRHLPDAPAFGRPAASAPRYRRRAARPEDGRAIPARHALPPRDHPAGAA